ncbi:PQQ-binding-like beta-propeller repeat protein [Streptomyces sp. NPDC021020]|uniref:PQQ-binding-like beta-propeller repeat protein n=1 Tax=Streptomyces sp. NPDC021020 TaxID=3365109 RepID=UPI0037939B2E
MNHSYGAAPRSRPTRRRLLRLAGGGAAAAVLGAGAAACGPEDAAPDDERASAGPAKSAPATKAPGKSPGKGGAPAPAWTATVPMQAGGVYDELMALDGSALTLGDPLTAWDAATGAKRWSAATAVVPGARLLHATSGAESTVYLASGDFDGSVAGFDSRTGKETWRSRLGKEYDQPQPIAVDGRQVYVTATILQDGDRTRGNVIAALDAASGRVVWKEQRDLGTEENGINAVVRGNRLVYTDFKKNLTVRDTATGHQVWTHKTAKINYDSFAVHQDLVVVAQQGVLSAYAIADGAQKWSLGAGEFAFFKTPEVIGDVLYVADSDRNLWAVDPVTGKQVFKATDLADRSAGIPVRFAKSGGTLLGATDLDEGGGVHAFDAATGALRWTFNDGSGDFKEWRVAADERYAYALHGPKLYALPV